MKFRPFFIVLLSFLFLPSLASARNVYLNGVKINGLLNQTFFNVKVKIDSKGDIYIVGAQYKVKVKGQTPPKAPLPKFAKTPTKIAPAPVVGSRPSKGYLAVVQRSGYKASGYAVHLKINGRLVRKIGLAVEQDVFKITKYLHKGLNKIVVEAFKMDAKAKGTFKLLIAAGKLKAGAVLITQPYLLKYTRKGSEMTSFRHIYNITIR